MRGVFFHQGLEFRLDVVGADFVQGSAISCALTVKNHSDIEQKLSDLKLLLALGTSKKVKAKATDAFEVLQSTETSSLVALAPKAEGSHTWNFELDKNCVVSDKSQSLYILYGNSAELSGLGQLLLTVAPHPHIQSLLSTFDTVFQFIPKGVSWKSGACVAKFKPPSSRRFSLVEELTLSCHFEDKDLDVHYHFTVKKFDTSAQTVAVKKGKTEVVQKFVAEKYLYGGNFIHQEFVEHSVTEALSTVASEL